MNEDEKETEPKFTKRRIGRHHDPRYTRGRDQELGVRFEARVKKAKKRRKGEKAGRKANRK